MPTGPPTPNPESSESIADRLIREAMEAGDFDALEGVGQPIPGMGATDDPHWWVRSWVERNREADSQEPNSSS